MGQVIEIEKWKRERNLGKTLGQLLTEYSDAQRAHIAARVSRETCHCYFADKYGYQLCDECPANEEK